MKDVDFISSCSAVLEVLQPRTNRWSISFTQKSTLLYSSILTVKLLCRRTGSSSELIVSVHKVNCLAESQYSKDKFQKRRRILTILTYGKIVAKATPYQPYSINEKSLNRLTPCINSQTSKIIINDNSTFKNLKLFSLKTFLRMYIAPTIVAVEQTT